MGVEETAAIGDALGQLLEMGVLTVGQSLVHQGPKSFGRLKLRGVRREADQGDTFGNDEFAPGVPARAVEHHGEDAFRSCACRLGELAEDRAHGLGADRRADDIDGLAGRGSDEGVQVVPLVLSSR